MKFYTSIARELLKKYANPATAANIEHSTNLNVFWYTALSGAKSSKSSSFSSLAQDEGFVPETLQIGTLCLGRGGDGYGWRAGVSLK